MSVHASAESETVGDRLDPKGIHAQDSRALVTDRQAIDASCRGPVLLFMGSSVVWLLVGTVLALLASIKLHIPTSWANTPGSPSAGSARPSRYCRLRLVGHGRPGHVHLAVCRLCRVPLRFPQMLVIAGIVWNIGTAAGLVGVLAGPIQQH